MQAYLKVLTDDEKNQVHERSLKILARTGVRVDTAKGRRILEAAGAQVDENTRIVRFPRNFVEQALGLAPRDFTLGARRSGWDKPMNAGDCSLLLDGEGTTVVDRKTGKHRPSTFHDWLEATRLADALDDIGIYWRIVQASDKNDTIADYVDYIVSLVRNFSKHFLDHPATLNAVRSNEWYINQLGVNASFEGWEAAGKPDVMQEAGGAVDRILAAHQPLPLDEEVDRELDRIRKKAADSFL